MEIPIMRHAAIATVMFGMLADVHTCLGQPFPSAGSPNPAMTAAPDTSMPGPSATPRPPATPRPSATPSPDVSLPRGSAPRAVTVARATEILACTLFVDAAANGRGTAQ